VRLLSALAAQTSLREMQIVAVCEEQNDDERELLEKFAAEMTNLTFVTYSGNSERFPIPELPYLLMIDKDNNLIVVNPRFIDLGSYVGRSAK
jgi:hypothetical protein